MNRKTATILTAAGSLCVAAVLLGSRTSPTSAPPIAPPPDDPGLRCGTPAPARATGPFAPGTFTAALSGEHALRGGDGEMYVSIDLVAREVETAGRPPMSVAIVIDNSGSMNGEKIARAREAARGLVERLRDSDRAALVRYDDRAELLVRSIATDEAGKRELLHAIARIRDDGGTNIHDGLVLGRDEILRELVPGHVNRVVLLSDGNANVGVTDIPSLSRLASDASERGVRITTVGLGADYNEDLMEALAEHGRGRYYFVKDAASLDAVFAGELRAIQATVATAAELRLEPACAGVELLEVFGYVSRREGNALVVPLADVAGGDVRKIVARLRVPTGEVGAIGVLTASLQYGVPGGKDAVARASLGISVTEDAAVVERSVDPTVLGKAEQAQSAAVIRQAAQAYERGDQAGAVQMLRAQRELTVKKAAKYRMKDAELAPIYESLDAMGAGMADVAPAAPEGSAMRKRVKADAYKLAK
jgi:Ca-activated chloride channel homolog